jgi:hypothetical protein
MAGNDQCSVKFCCGSSGAEHIADACVHMQELELEKGMAACNGRGPYLDRCSLWVVVGRSLRHDCMTVWHDWHWHDCVSIRRLQVHVNLR